MDNPSRGIDLHRECHARMDVVPQFAIIGSHVLYLFRWKIPHYELQLLSDFPLGW